MLGHSDNDRTGRVRVKINLGLFEKPLFYSVTFIFLILKYSCSDSGGTSAKKLNFIRGRLRQTPPL
jgi:hypothetical protein